MSAALVDRGGNDPTANLEDSRNVSEVGDKVMCRSRMSLILPDKGLNIERGVLVSPSGAF